MTILPTLRQLQFLVAATDTRHFGRAAERCNATQSTLSAGIKELEENVLQARLIERTKRRVMPTPLGLAIAEQARQLLNGAEALVETARSGGQPLTGTFRLGTIPTVGPFLLPRVMQGLRRAYPGLKMFIREDQTRPLLERLRKGELEAALIALPYDVEDFEVMDLGPDRFWLVAPRNHALMCMSAREVPASRIEAGELLLLEDGHCMREHALSACHLDRNPSGEKFEATSLYTIVEMVANGLGVTFLPELAITSGLAKSPALERKPLAKDSPARHIGLVWRKSYHREGDVAALGAYLQGRLAGLRLSRR